MKITMHADDGHVYTMDDAGVIYDKPEGVTRMIIGHGGSVLKFAEVVQVDMDEREVQED